jgi:tRNA(Ile2) C34 agmatinyltransferase TiaS
MAKIKESVVEARRPHCPNCEMRMIAAAPNTEIFECLRCGYRGPAIPKQASAA